MRRVLTLTLLALTFPAAAGAAGGPVPPFQGVGVAAPGSGDTFVALGAGRAHTVVQRVRRGDGVVERYRTISGSFGVPGAAYDNSTTGLSADGRTLVLAEINFRYPPKSTTLAVLDARSVRTRARITLPGSFTVDAISPDGRWLYLIHNQNTAATRYEVRGYDLQQRQLLPKPIVDPREPDEKMQGQPVTRVMSPDGRWAYTLYARPEGAPFIHALDTQNRTAACIDLPLRGAIVGHIFDMRLRLGPGGALQVEYNGSPALLVDTRTFAVRTPAQQPARSAVAPEKGDGGSSFPWALMAIPAAAALAGLGVVARRRRRLRSAPA
jgi:hypothetical protein